MKQILCYGDSNTYGCNPAWTPEWNKNESKTVRFSEKERWSGILGDLLGDDYHVVEEGLGGRTTVFPDPIYPHCNGKSTLIPILLSHAPLDLVIIMLGSNDLKVTFNPSPDTLSLAMEELLKTVINPFLWEHKKVPQVLLMSPPLIRDNIKDSPFFGMYDEKSVRLSHELGRIYQNLSLDYGIHFLDASDYAAASELDCLHMDPENHRRLAEAVKNKIQEIFG